MQLIVFLLVFMLFLSTYLFQVGLLDTLWAEFRLITIAMPVYLLVFVAYLATKAVSAMSSTSADTAGSQQTRLPVSRRCSSQGGAWTI